MIVQEPMYGVSELCHGGWSVKAGVKPGTRCHLIGVRAHCLQGLRGTWAACEAMVLSMKSGCTSPPPCAPLTKV